MPRESVIDLTLARNIALYDWQVLPDIGSDHHAILFRIPIPASSSINSKPVSTRFNTSKADWELFSSSLRSSLNTSSLNSPEFSELSSETSLSSSIENLLDQVAQDFTNSVLNSAKVAIPSYKLEKQPKAWWNQELKALRTTMLRQYRRAKRDVLASQDYTRARNSYYAAIRLAKQEH